MSSKKHKKHSKHNESRKKNSNTSKGVEYLIPTLILAGFGLVAGAVYLALSTKTESYVEQPENEEMLEVSDDHPEDADLEEVIEDYGTDSEQKDSADYVDTH